jgi:hypothetical protein
MSKELIAGIDRINLNLQDARRAMTSDTGPSITLPQLHGVLIDLAGVYWSPQLAANERQDLLDAYLSALRTIKLFADDVFIEMFAHLAKLAPDARQKREEEIHGDYIGLTQDWIRSSPMLERDVASALTFAPPNTLVPQFLRRRFGPSRRPMITGAIADRASAALETDISRARQAAARRRGSFRLLLRLQTIHLYGLLFLLVQLELIEDSLIIPPSSSNVADWYTAEAVAIDWLRTTILGVLGVLERKALIAGATVDADQFRNGAQQLFRELADVYSIRSREIATMWTFLDRSLKRRIASPNGITEYLAAMPGRPNPDDQDNVGAKSVDVLLNDPALEGRNVKAYGLKKKVARSKRFSLQSTESTNKIEVRFDALTLPAAVAPYVVADGVFTRVGGRPVIIATKVDEFRVPYVARVGLRMRHPFSEGWRTTTTALESAAVEDQVAESLPAALAGQDELVADLLHNERIRTSFQRELGRAPYINLANRGIRVRAWQTLLEYFRREKRPDPVADLFGFIQRYLELHTRHTFWNVRDYGKSYLDTTWPRDLQSKALHDCGVYAVEVAYDLFLVVNGLSQPQGLEFDLLCAADHMVLIGYIGDRSFMVNNRRIDLPVDLPAGDLKQSRELAQVRAMGQGYRRIHNLRYNVVPFVRTKTPITTRQSDTSFRRTLWTAYLGVTKWGMGPSGDQYYEDMRSFDANSRDLEQRWGRIEPALVASDPADSEVVAASDRATALFRLAELLVTRQRFVGGKIVGVCGISFNEKPPLPMYAVARALQSAQEGGTTLTPAQQVLVSELPTHENKLLNLWCPPRRSP